MITHPRVLLLGAGFTANFGAPVASEIWGYLFNNKCIQKSEYLKNLLEKYSGCNDFEGFYEQVINSQDHSLEKEIVISVLSNIYNQINQDTQLNFESCGISFKGLIFFLRKFSKRSNGKGFVFTLNQDLFLEWLFNQYKFFSNDLVLELIREKIKYFGPIEVPNLNNSWYRENTFATQEIFENHVCLPSDIDIKKWEKNNGIIDNNQSFPFYVKLHGSFGWVKNDGNSVPVLGGNKLNQINQEALLKFYKFTFEETLNEKLAIWVIGYSFSDEHINSILIDSMVKHKSSIFIIDIKPLNKLYEDISKYPILYKALKENLSGYFPYNLAKLFPRDGNASIYLSDQLKDSLEDPLD